MIKFLCVFGYFFFLISKTYATKICLSDSDVDTFWEEYKAMHGKKYSVKVDAIRKRIWEQHVADITQHNILADLGRASFKRGINEYTDLNEAEYHSRLLGYVRPPNATKSGTPWKPPKSFMVPLTLGVNVGGDGHNYLFPIPGSESSTPTKLPVADPSGPKKKLTSMPGAVPIDDVSSYSFTYNASDYSFWIPDSLDWRDYGVVTEVKNQGSCGSCWAFSTTGTMEAQIAFMYGSLPNFSEQNLVDCVTTNLGCKGGWMESAFQYIRTSGVEDELYYPYTGVEGACNANANLTYAKCQGYYTIPPGDEDSLKSAVATEGPVAVAIDASLLSFSNYKFGIYNDPACDKENVNHAVLVVGYGTQSGSDYWLIKNSWGESWGINGYMMMARNQNNTCGIATVASFPIV